MNDLQPVLDDENSDVDQVPLVKKLSGLNLTVSFDTWPARPTLLLSILATGNGLL